MLPFHRLYRAIISYRLGYSPQRPYPGRWTTPVVLGAFILLASALAAINVPLSAYEMDQESTFRPNDTLPPLPFSSLIPEILQHPAGSFSPQILTVGDTIQLNNSVYNFTMMAAFNELDNFTQPVSSFSYYNNPISDGCDVVRTDFLLRNSSDDRRGSDLSQPNFVHLGMEYESRSIISGSPGLFPGPSMNPAQANFKLLAYDLLIATGLTWRISSGNGFDVLVPPILDAESFTDQYGESLLPTKPPCSSVSARLMVAGGYIVISGRAFNLELNNTDIFGDQLLRSAAPDVPWVDLNTVVQNIFQSTYHLVRMELGVILGNQIYVSPEMYSQTISANSLAYGASSARLSTTDATLMADWRDIVRLFNETDRVPVMPYLRSVPRLKPLRSAITSVFVSTFAMLSVTRTIFSLIAGTVAASRANKAVCEEDEATINPRPYMRKDLEGQQGPMQEWDTSEASLFVSEDKRVTLMETVIQKNSVAMSEMQFSLAEMQLSLARMRLSLRARGVLEEVDEDPRNINEVERERRGALFIIDSQALEEHPLLVHRANRSSTLDSAV
ncbi:hypothetical protein B0H17DRAFT_1284978 [Mycena rosella]|uniref:Uncharacterized protein n=1 Tax=Mycena rosella TaxID=1033263 RepID=A0AAD7BSC6_MYCRO|nr:hypothetical protein B0H17DRAFT_1284978 [Mycena rosella]